MADQRVRELQRYTGRRCKNLILGGYGEVAEVKEQYGDICIIVHWDNGSVWPYSPEQIGTVVEIVE
jgi:hypothetical protein